MIFKIYSIRDSVAGSFLTPTVDQSDSTAIRNFSLACDSGKRDSSLLAFRPADFSLYCLAEFDSESGLISPFSPIQLVVSGDSVSK
ncbi:nonstructural protein [Sigmofec virus UA08Rod_5898]|uniref:Nonstructural protein n=1 Tax=Sigmofec virus UA08Rod_5898 TaxID=2929444 RepID=A0A976R7Y2_9VIRU|nr:nonstructural protein [Sigmofec virus UA08Rod_5898]